MPVKQMDAPVVDASVPAIKVAGKSTATRTLRLSDTMEISFKLYVSADDPKGSGLNKACPHCTSRVSMPNICSNEQCDHAGPLSEVIHVYSDGTETYPITKDEMASIGQPDKDDFIIHSRLPEAQAEALLYKAQRKWYLAPAGNASALGYAVLKAALIEKSEAILVKFCIRSDRQQLAIIIAEGDMLVLIGVPFYDEVRMMKDFTLPASASPKYVKDLHTAFDSLPVRKYSEANDEYDDKLRALIEQKVQARAKTKGKPKEKAQILTVSRKMVVVS